MSKPRLVLGALCAFLCIAGAAPAWAQPLPFTGLYIRGDAGASWVKDADLHDKNFATDGIILGNAAGTAPGKLNDLGTGWLLGGGIGAQVAPAFRADVVYTYRGGYKLSDTDQGSPPAAFGAHAHSHSVMANIYWDIPLTGFQPFVGGGIGWARNTMADVNETVVGSPTFFLHGGDRDNFAWQLMAGVSFGLPGRINLDVFYRYFDGGDIETKFGNVIQSGTIVGTYSGMLGDLRAHEVVASIRFPLGP